MTRSKIFIHAYSYEERATEILNAWKIKERACDLIITLDYTQVPTQLSSAYRTNRRIINKQIKELGIEHQIIELRYDAQIDFIKRIKVNCSDNTLIELDITNLTKLHVLRLLLELSSKISYVTYVSANNHHSILPDSNSELLKFNNKNSIIAGFEGVILPELPTILVIITGFEKTRALSAYNAISPDICVQVTGVPWLEPQKAVEYIEKSSEINKQLSYHQNCFSELAPSLCPRGFSSRLRDIISKYKKIYRIKGVNNCNVVVVPLGTKVQTLGTFFYCKRLINHTY